jgi:hypothetical protein
LRWFGMRPPGMATRAHSRLDHLARLLIFSRAASPTRRSQALCMERAQKLA